jgi:phosphoribosylformimino-5-aminoimidazole carboxamide ribotide isomerase
MRIVPVLDLKGGIVVHARRGQRAHYAPLLSSLVDGCEPVAVARALCAVSQTRSLYVADLDALTGEPVDVATLAALSVVAELWVDAGAAAPERAADLARAGVARNIVGTESLGLDYSGIRSAGVPGMRAAGVPGMRAAGAQAPPLVLSIDLRDGRLISPRPELAGRGPVAAAPLATALGVRELIVIDLARVGSASGPPLAAVADLAAALPGCAIYAGGGVRDDADLRALESAGATGALVATALHEGRITPRPALHRRSPPPQ